MEEGRKGKKCSPKRCNRQNQHIFHKFGFPAVLQTRERIPPKPTLLRQPALRGQRNRRRTSKHDGVDTSQLLGGLFQVPAMVL